MENIDVLGTLKQFALDTGFVTMSWQQLVMIGVACVFLFLAIKRQYEPLLLVPIAFGMLLTTLPGAGMYHTELFSG